MSKRTQSQSRKRKAIEPMVISPSIKTRSQKFKLNDYKPESQTPIKINLAEQFSKITIDSEKKKITKKSEKSSRAQTPKSSRKSKLKPSIKDEESKNEDSEIENLSCSSNPSTSSRVTRQSSRNRKESSHLDDSDSDGDIYVYNHVSFIIATNNRK